MLIRKLAGDGRAVAQKVGTATPLAVLAVLAMTSAASAVCNPPAVDAANPAPGSTVTCSGATVDQNGGTGYGTGDQTGVTINVDGGATVTGGAAYGIRVGDAVVNNLGTINGAVTGFIALTGAATLVNWGVVNGSSEWGVFSQTDTVVVTNHATGTITGSMAGLRGSSVSANNSGSISGGDNEIFATVHATLTNNAGATVTGGNGVIGNTGVVTVTNSGTITATLDMAVGGDNAVVTNNAGGIIQGNLLGIRGFTGSSTVWNAGTISGGLAAIRFDGIGNTLTLAPTSVIIGNVLGSGVGDTLQLGGTGSGSFNIASVDNAAQYQGFSTFNKIDSSTWTLTGTSTFAGPINVDGGTLRVNGNTVSASAVTVNAGGTLGGTGTVGGTTINGGALAPGNSIGTLTVSGNLVFTSAASYIVEVSPAAGDRTNVTGTATLGGATVQASFAPGGYVVKQYTILNATGGVSGTFGAVVNSNMPSGFKTSLSYDASNVYLNLDLALAQYSGLNVNQGNVANALTNYFNATGGIPLVFGSLTPAGLTIDSGEHATGAQQTTVDAMGLFLGVLTDPFGAGRGGPASPGAAQFADEQPTRSVPSDAYAAIAKAAPRAPCSNSAGMSGPLASVARRPRTAIRRSAPTPRPAGSPASPLAPTPGCRRSPWRASRSPAAPPISTSTASAPVAPT